MLRRPPRSTLFPTRRSSDLVKLSELSGAPNVIIQILPFSAGAHPAMDSAFSVVTFDPPTPGDVVYFEYPRSEEHTSELQSQFHLVCRLLLEKKNNKYIPFTH